MILLGTLNEYSSSDIDTITDINGVLYAVSPSVYKYLLNKGCNVDMAYLISKRSLFTNNIGEKLRDVVYIPEKYKYKDMYYEYISNFKVLYLEDFI